MASRRLNVNLDQIVEAMDCHLDGTIEWFVDTETGDVHPISDDGWSEDDEEEDPEGDDSSLRPWQREAKSLAAQVHSDDVRYVSIPQNETWESYRLMEEFIEGVKNPRLRNRLADAIAGKGAFRRFKDVLFEDPDVRERWFAFENGEKRKWAAAWLASIGIESTWHPPRPPPLGPG